MRHPDWRARLATYLEGAREQRFRYGVHDCGLFVGGAIEAMTGHDVCAAVRGAYHGPASARRLLGGDTPEALMSAVDALLGKRMAPGEAVPGDVLAVAVSDSRVALGVCVGAGDLVALARYPRGLIVRDVGPALAAWSV